MHLLVAGGGEHLLPPAFCVTETAEAQRYQPYNIGSEISSTVLFIEFLVRELLSIGACAPVVHHESELAATRQTLEAF